MEEEVERSGEPGTGGWSRARPQGYWGTVRLPLCPVMPVLTKKLRWRRAFNEERRTVAVRQRGWERPVAGRPAGLVVRASAFEEAMWY